MKRIEVRIAGLGGQGVVLIGQILGKAAVYDGKNAVQTQNYGAEARGTMTKSEVIISEGKINFPAVRQCDILVAMNQEAADKNSRNLKENGLLLIDSTMVKTVPKVKARVCAIPATELSEKAFQQKTYANMIILGALIKMAEITSKLAVEKAIRDTVAEKYARENLQAYRIGIKSAC